MPIRPENRDRYPANWKEIREQVRQRAGDRCEGHLGLCGVQNGAWGWRELDGSFVFVSFDKDEAVRKEGRRKLIKIVLTTAHLDHIPENCDLSNLRFLCQQCHNRYDAPMRAAGRRERRKA